MFSFTLNNANAFNNIKLYCNSIQNNDFFNVKINGKDCFLPLEVAISLSNLITEKILIDPTLREIDINIQFNNENSPDLINSILKNLENNTENSLFSEEQLLIDFAKFGLVFGNSSFIEPLKAKFKDEQHLNEMDINDILKNIEYKQLILQYSKNENSSQTNISINEELSFISSNFYKIYKEKSFIDWCSDFKNLSYIETILLNDDLVIQTEDSLLDFILNLSKHNTLFHILFSYVHLEFCSVEYVEKFISYIEDYFHSKNYSKVDLCIIECLSRRCKHSLKDLQNPTSKRYKQKPQLSPRNFYYYEESDPRNGLLFNENIKNNVIINVSSNNNPNNESYNPIHLLEKLQTEYAFYSKSEVNSSISFSLKDNSSFVINKYMIRGNGNRTAWIMKSWKIEGQLADTKEWVVIDTKDNQEKFQLNEDRIFDIPETKPLVAIKITQTSPNHSNNNHLVISSFETYGYIL